MGLPSDDRDERSIGGQMVSVIIPVYNTENYLDECICSVVNQDYPNLEIILINDGSTDRSGSICRKWEALDSRIRYVEKENEGQGTARNLGIRMASGAYLIFVDSDDYIEENLVSLVYRRITEEKADICVYASCGIGSKENNNGLELKLSKGSNVRENKELLGQMTPILCNKMFSVGLLWKTGLTMNNRMCEDLVFNARIYMEAERICFLDCPLYHYRYLREGNFSTNYERYSEVEESIQELNATFQREGRFEEYWRQLYEISFNMFKTVLFRIGVWKEYHVPQGIQNRYPAFFCSYKNFLSKWFREYLTMELQEKNFLLVGSYSLRVIIHTLLLREEFLREDYASGSIVSLMCYPCRENRNISTCAGIAADRLNLLLESNEWKNPYRKRCVEQDIRKHFQSHAGLEKADYVAVDLLDEICDLIEMEEGYYITESEFLREVERKTPGVLDDCARIPFVSPARRELFRKYAPLFAQKLKQAGVRVIVVKNFLCEKHGDYYDRLMVYGAAEYDSGEYGSSGYGSEKSYSLEEIREVNRELEWCYEYLLRCLPEALVADAADFQELAFTYDHFAFGRKPVYYNSGYYQRMAIQVNQAIRSSLETSWLSDLKRDMERYDRVFLIREDEPSGDKLLKDFLGSRAIRETKKKVLVMAVPEQDNMGKISGWETRRRETFRQETRRRETLRREMPGQETSARETSSSVMPGEKNGAEGGVEYRRITEENAHFLLSLYHMYEFSDRFRLISTRELCGNLFQFLKTGLLSAEEVWEALLS